MKLLPWPGGSGYLMAAYSRYGFDSSVVNLVRLAPDLTATRHREYRLGLPLSYMFTASGFGPTDWLLGGALENPFGANRPYVICTDSLFAPRWSVRFTNLTHSQSYVIKLLPQGANDFVAYTYTDVGSADGMYRLSGNRAGTRFAGWLMQPAPATPGGLRVFDAVPGAGRPDEQFLAGTGKRINNTREMDALLLKVDSTRVRWSKLLHFGRDAEAIYNFIRTANGDLVVPVTNNGVAGSVYPTIVCRLDTAGTLLWAREVASPTVSLYLRNIVETAQHELIISGNDLNFNLVVVKLSATGDLLWARQAASSGQYAGAFTATPTGAFVMAAGFTLSQLDAAGTGCGFGPAPGITSVPLTPAPGAILDLPLTMTPFTPLTQAEPLLARTLSLTRAVSCVAVVGTPEAAAPAERLGIYPNPATGTARVTGLLSVPSPIELRLLDGLGRTVRRQLTAGPEAALELRGLPPGLYVLRVGGQVTRLVVE